MAFPAIVTIVRTVRASLALTVDRLDASFHASPGEAAASRLIASGRQVHRLGDFGEPWTPSRFSRVWAAPGEAGVPYLRPYDTFDYLPVAADRLSEIRTGNLESLRLTEGDLLITCSGRNLGPTAYVGSLLSTFALSHDMVRVRTDAADRYWLFAYLRSDTGQALLRRGRSGSVIDHITVDDVRRLPVPELEVAEKEDVSALVSHALEMRERARASLLAVIGDSPVAGTAAASTRATWDIRAAHLADRLDAARYHPAVQAAASDPDVLAGPTIGDLAEAVLPTRYRRLYVAAEHGRPVLSGRQLLQADTVNLRYVSDKSFRDPSSMELRPGASVFGAVGRSEGRVGQAALISADRAGFLASNDVMRLFPRDGVRPGAVWAVVADPRTQAQIKSLSFGSVIDHMNPWDVEALHVPTVDDATADTVEDAWQAFSDAAVLLNTATELIESLLAESA